MLCNAKTSEELFGIVAQPENQCPTIDREIKDWNTARVDIKYYCKDLNGIEGAESIAKDIEWEVERLDLVGGFEEIRKKCEDIRTWGQEWKDLAQQLLSERQDIGKFLSDQYSERAEDIEHLV